MNGGRKKILVIRGGAVGDFLLTLPALRLLREGFPDCRLELMGYRHICEIANGRFYADGVRSLEYSAMAGFFNPKSELDPELCEYFSGFGQIISYLYDPDGFFEGNLRRCGVRNLITGDPRIHGPDHAALHLARPLESLALFLENPTAEIFPSEEDLTRAAAVTAGNKGPTVAVHAGSGSKKKNWPLENWGRLISELSSRKMTVWVVGGESDHEEMAAIRAMSIANVHFLESPDLCTLGAFLSRCSLYIGHDTGISHLACAAGTRAILLFGPTDPEIWAPRNPGAVIIRGNEQRLENICLKTVLDHVDSLPFQSLSSGPS